MGLSSVQFGHFRLFTVETGTFRLDGGAMFGVVPKTLWSRNIACDDKNRILMSVRCLLVHSQESGRVYLIDAGTGHKFDEKFNEIYGIDFSEYTLEASLNFHGFKFSDVTDVIFTHMHFDHCGGATLPSPGQVAKKDQTDPADKSTTGNPPAGPEQAYRLAFPGARHWIHRAQWENVLNPNIREKASYLRENIEPLSKSGMTELIDDHHIYESGFGIRVANGHTPGQQLPYFTVKQRTLLYAADLLPTTAHLPLPWVMGFDTRPLVTFKEKEKILGECIEKKTLIYLQHDPENELILPGNTAQRPTVNWSGRLDNM